MRHIERLGEQNLLKVSTQQKKRGPCEQRPPQTEYQAATQELNRPAPPHCVRCEVPVAPRHSPSAQVGPSSEPLHIDFFPLLHTCEEIEFFTMGMFKQAPVHSDLGGIWLSPISITTIITFPTALRSKV